MIDNDVVRDIAAKRKYWFIPLYLGRAGILPSDNQEWCGVWLHGALLSIDTRAVFNPARNMVQSLYIVKDYTIRAMKIPDVHSSRQSAVGSTQSASAYCLLLTAYCLLFGSPR